MSAGVCCTTHTHANFDVDHYFLVAELLKIFIELDPALFECDNDARATELEEADLVTLFDLVAGCAEGFVDPIDIEE